MKTLGEPLPVLPEELTELIADRLACCLPGAQIPQEIAAVPDLAAMHLLLDKVRELYWVNEEIAQEVVSVIKCRVLQLVIALTSVGGRERTIPRYIADPDQAMLPLLMEHLAVALNSRQDLVGGGPLVGLLAAEPGARPLLRQFARHLADQEWALYEVKRAFRKKEGEAMKMANAARSLVRVDAGDRAEMIDKLAVRARALNKPVERDSAHRRVWAHRKNMYYPCVEELLTVAPALAPDKIGPGFDEAWKKGLRGPRQLQLVA